eukprot:TRINITY_DN815_c0_g1_i2.p1 TRINITY_DN815_c0_g1~~TRINITY_DN815_c0_g1_i2.p1  ORF type:complete len:203 (+),score=64.65 TRINITY_DN815_c0_g1_i2:37-609(+)
MGEIRFIMQSGDQEKLDKVTHEVEIDHDAIVAKVLKKLEKEYEETINAKQINIPDEPKVDEKEPEEPKQQEEIKEIDDKADEKVEENGQEKLESDEEADEQDGGYERCDSNPDENGNQDEEEWDDMQTAQVVPDSVFTSNEGVRNKTFGEKPLDVEKIKNLMAKMTIKTPPWAANISDEEWDKRFKGFKI